jgi:hypothetical protein
MIVATYGDRNQTQSPSTDRRPLAFSQGGPPAFDAMDVDRLAAVLGLRLTFDVPK